jgi:acyl-CoA synthetase (AMP-forming)/AMP-acid ligase II
METAAKDYIFLTDKLDSLITSKPNFVAFRFLHETKEGYLSLTYKDLGRKAKALAFVLKEKTVSGDKALLLYPSGLDFIVAFFACLYADIIPVLAYPPDSENIDRLITIAEDCNPDLVLCTNSVLSQLDDFEAKNRMQNSAELNRKLKVLYDLLWIPSDIIKANGVLRKRKEDSYNRNQVALIQYSAGTTGIPKRIEVTHRSLYMNSLQFLNAFDVNSDTNIVSWLHPYHDMGFLSGVIAPVFSGIQTTLMEPLTFIKKPFYWLKEISNLKGRGKVISGGPNFAFEMCCHKIKDEQLSELDLRHWKIAFNGGDSVKQETLERFTHKFTVCGFSPKAFVPVYGLTEAAPLVSDGSFGKGVTARNFSKSLFRNHTAVETPLEKDCVKLISYGKVLNNFQVIIIDPKSGHKLEDGAVGEILIADSGLALNFYDNLEFSREHFYNDIKFLKTGDLGFIKSDELFVTGSLKDLIVLNGAIYYPHFIEHSVSYSHPALRKGCCAAFTITKENKDVLVVVQEVSRDAINKVSVEELLEKIRSDVFNINGIEPYMVCLTFPSSIPKTFNGKIQRSLAKALFLQNTLKVIARWQNSQNEPKETNYSGLIYLPAIMQKGRSRGAITTLY